MASFLGGSNERVWSAAGASLRSLRARLEQAALTAPQRFFAFRNVSAMAYLRRHRPILRIGSAVVVVARREDVMAVLEDDRSFPTPYTDGLASGFVLGLTGPDADRHRAALDDVLRFSDRDSLEQHAAALAQECVDNAGPGRMAVGSELVRPVLTGIVGRYLGITGPSSDVFMVWSRLIFQDIFLNNAELPTVHDRGQVAVEALDGCVREAVASRRQMIDRPDDVLTRFLAMEETGAPVRLTEDEIVDNLIGLAIGWLWHGAKAALGAVDVLLDRPEALATAAAAARDNELERLRQVIWEALRFHAVQVGLPRVCAHATTLAAGTPYETEVPAGAGVLAGTHSAMWDDRVVPDPGRFDPGRPEDHYVIFGHGRHHCLGEAIMRRQLPAMLQPLLALDGLARALGRPGKLTWVGPHPDDLWVRFSR